MIKKLLIFFGIHCFIMLISLQSYAGLKLNLPSGKGGVTTVVIDAGHGGKDPGCLGHKAKEKDICLAIALALGRDIEKNCPDVKVIYTRHDDNFVELFQRAEIANKNKADLFISIHCNSSPSPEAYGVETYVMGLYKSQANLNVAKKENSSILLENDYKKNYGGFDPNSPEAYIIFSLYQNAYIDQSIDLASKIEKQVGKAGRFGRGVKQAGFLVIYKTTMPSMLVEAGFLTNPNEEAFLLTEEGKNTIAMSIYKAFREYKNEREGRKGRNKNEENIAVSNENSNYKQNVSNVNNDSTKGKVKRKKINADTKKQKEKSEALKADTSMSKLKSQNSKNNIQQNDMSANQQVESRESKANKQSPVVIFKIQFATSPVKKDVHSSKFKGLENVDYYIDNGVYKFTYGNDKDMSEAKKDLNKLKEKGYKDAFIIAFSDGKRLKSISEALNLQKISAKQ